MYGVNFALEVFCILVCLILLISQIPRMNVGEGSQKWFSMMLIFNILMMVGELPVDILSGTGGILTKSLIEGGGLLYFLLSGLLVFAFTGYVLAFINAREGRTNKAFWDFCAVLAGIQMILTAVSMWTGIYFYVDDQNVYHRGPYFFIAQMIPILMFVINIVMMTYNRKRMRSNEWFLFLAYTLIPMAALIIQIMEYSFVPMNVMVTLALILVFIFIHFERELVVERQKEELSGMQVDIMLSQIQPHFLYNSLTAIRQLCDIDPQQAKQSILDFSHFLRANMNSLTISEPIPFRQELDHITSYLNLEKQRFGDRLNVEFDVRVEDFYLPTLTLQPLVENSIRHGIMKKDEGGTIWFSTEEDENNIIIQVRDNGQGFDPRTLKETNKGDHVGLFNIRHRLKTQVNADVIINSIIGLGTNITIVIPKVEKEETSNEISGS